MSVSKRPRGRQPETSTLPSSKRVKLGESSHVPKKNGLEFLVNENARSGRKLDAKLTNGVHRGKSNRVDEADAVVAADARDEDGVVRTNGKAHEIIDISSAEEESSAYESSDGEREPDLPRKGTNSHADTNGADDEDVNAELGAADDRNADPQDAEMEDAVDEEAGAPSFADLLQARHPGPVDVHGSLTNGTAEQSAAMSASSNRALATTSNLSLGIVLTQGLRTNDKDLLESAFITTDLASIRSTIERLQSHLAALLLQKLAERIHKSPGRTGKLMVWIQWTLVTHGGYLASQPAIMHTLRSLAQVVRERAGGLQPLLHLKGKLDILSAQLDYRKKIQASSRLANAEDDEDEEAVVYTEGRDDDSLEDDEAADEEPRQIMPPPAARPKGKGRSKSELPSDGDESEDEGMPNGVTQEGEENDDDEEEDGAEEDEALFDEEAEETSDDENQEADSDEEASSAAESEDESEASEDDSEPEVKSASLKTLNRKR
ncbi:Small subunit (SSU) processome component [Recurvomyces mirabilis]|uniref:Small subunit (SSU) processome component n=1 Tax=Recurvomyces mirabilis TaxID=574656 RepID=A0AAE0WNJ9_9PEZI|nr:Small subunit (SSU) processome component [Recurvomyces mirabilis]KAK5158350.1 Small subunit (SSU) processome component [Recurvomyces mirabilis]